MRTMPAEHENEPVRGLPGRLPEGERLLWQGAPTPRLFAVHALHLRWLAGYFAALMVLSVALSVRDGEGAVSLIKAVLIPVGLAAAAGGLLWLYAWLTCRSTVYTITNKRVVIRFGVALPATFNFPFARIDTAHLQTHADDSGDISLELDRSTMVGYLLLWPHVRPWKLANAQPMLRALPEGAKIAQLLARALAASAEMPAPTAPVDAAETVGRGKQTALA